MAHDGIKITDLRTEVMTLVNSDPVKYDPNNNGKIDAGNELSQLLSEYQCTASDLTSADKKPMWTLAEQQEIREQGRENSKSNKRNIKLFGAVAAAAGVGAGAYFLKKGISKTTEQVKFQKFVNIEKFVADGSYTPGARPAYDIGTSMKQYITEQQAKRITSFFNADKERYSIVELNRWPADGRRFTRDIHGKPFVLRAWKPGDPQFVTQGTKVVEEFKPVTKRVFNIKLLKRGGFIGVGAILVGGLTAFIGSKMAQRSAENDVKLNIKSVQTADGERIMQQRRQHEEEIRQREAALKQEELDYRERMHAATQGVDTRLQSAEQRARNINRELNEAQSIIAPVDTIAG